MTTHVYISKHFVFVLLISAFALNWVWEVAQSSAYHTAEQSMPESLLFCTLASVIDAVTISGIFIAAAFLVGRGGWSFYIR